MKALVLGLVFVCACAQAPRPDTSAQTWLAKVRAAHAAADVAGTAEGRKIAYAALRVLAQEPAPPSVAAVDAASVRRDLYGRAVRLALSLQLDFEAKRMIDEGLALEGHDPYHTQLLLLSVETQRALGHEAAAAEAERTARAALQR